MSELTSSQVFAPPKLHYRTTALIIASALFMEQLDSTVLATALPTMARYFDVSPSHMSVALTSYLLSLAVLIPASGHIADRFGSRTVFAGAIVVFTLSSILCAQAPNLPMLVLARLLQGAGGALMIPVGRLVLLRSVDRRDLMSAMTWLLVPALIGPILGPPVGGMIVTYLDWRWIFFINVPIGVLGLLLTLAFIPNTRSTTRQPFDVVGFVLSGVSLSSLLFGFEMTSRGVGGLWVALTLIGIGVVSGVGLCRLRLAPERHDADSRPQPDADQDVPRVDDRRIAFAHHGRRAPVPAAADDAARLWHVGGRERHADLRHRRRLHADEGRGDPDLAALRLPQHADLERDLRQRAVRDLRRLPAVLAALAAVPGACGLRLLQFAAVHRLQHGRL